MKGNIQAIKSAYLLECLNSLQGVDAVRKLHALTEEHTRFTTIREGEVTALNGIPVFITYSLIPEEEELRLRMLKGAHGYWRGGNYHLTYSQVRNRKERI